MTDRGWAHTVGFLITGVYFLCIALAAARLPAQENRFWSNALLLSSKPIS